MKDPKLADLKNQALDIIGKMQKMGFPTSENIEEFTRVVDDLQKLKPKFRTTHQRSIEDISSHLEEIKEMLKKEEEIPVRLYTKLNAHVVLFKENLLSNQD